VAAASGVPVFAHGEQDAAPQVARPAEEQSFAPPPPVREWAFEDILEKVWRLAAIKIGYGSIQLDRAAMKTAGIDETYVLQFKEEGINGKALFNYYFAPFVKHEGKEVAFRQIVGTRMASPGTINAGGLGEEEYYWYLQRVMRWNIVNDRLELYTGDGEITLYFIQ
jgi:heat shock protein HslJ